MKYANLRVLQVLAITTSIVVPIGFVSGYRSDRAKAEQPRKRPAAVPLVEQPPFGHCTPVVNSIEASHEYLGWDGVRVDLDWGCGNGQSGGCPIFYAVVLYEAGEPYPGHHLNDNVFHLDNGLNCGSGTVDHDVISFMMDLPVGNYTASVTVYGSSLEDFNPDTPVLAHTNTSWQIVEF